MLNWLNEKGTGIHLTACINGCGVNFVVDSGSTITVVSVRVFDKIPNHKKPALEHIKERFVLADGGTMNVLGRCVVDLSIGNLYLKHEVVVADVAAEGLLGSDFMMKHNCILDFQRQSMVIDGEKVNIREELGELSICRVKVASDVEIPAGKEMVVPGQLIRRGKHANCGVIEPSSGFIEKHGLLVGRTLVDPTRKIIPIRIMNISHESKKMHQDTVIGTFHTVNEVSEVLSKMAVDDEECQKGDTLPDHLVDLFNRSSEHLSEQHVCELRSFLLEFQDVFAKSDHDLGRTGLVKHTIDTGDSRPVKQPLRRVPIHKRLEEERQVKEMLEKGVIEESNSPWSSAIVLVKKSDNSTRCCIDYRKLNELTVKDAYPLPRADDCFDSLTGAQWFSTLDLCSGYWQVELDPSAKPKTAFITRSGLYQFKVVPFGLCNAGATFERLMELVMAGLQWKICLIYLDDVIVYGESFDQELGRLRQVFLRLRNANLKLKAKKCSLFKRKVVFLGHVVSPEGISADPSKVESIKSWPVPKNTTEVRSFIGLCSYYRKFVKGFAEIAGPLHKLTEKNARFEWSEKCQAAFETLKECLMSTPILAYPDENVDFILDTDASHQGIGAVLSQVHNGSERVIAYGSRKMSRPERRYCVTRKELLAIVHFVKHFRHYLYGRKFLIRTDHGSLRWLMNFKNPEGQLARWLEVLGSYTFDIQHRPGKKTRKCGRIKQGSM